jgi:hypothetical protein
MKLRGAAIEGANADCIQFPGVTPSGISGVRGSQGGQQLAQSFGYVRDGSRGL